MLRLKQGVLKICSQFLPLYRLTRDFSGNLLYFILLLFDSFLICPSCLGQTFYEVDCFHQNLDSNLHPSLFFDLVVIFETVMQDNNLMLRSERGMLMQLSFVST